MAIVNHTLETSAQANGSTHNVLRMYDQDGISYMISFFAPAGANLSSLVAEKINNTNSQLAESEFQTIVGID